MHMYMYGVSEAYCMLYVVHLWLHYKIAKGSTGIHVHVHVHVAYLIIGTPQKKKELSKGGII